MDTSSTAARAAALLRDHIQNCADGQFLGSEESLANQVGVSAPILRQAARLLQHEQLLDIRRGVNGGYYARRPTIYSVVHPAAVFLRMNNATKKDIIEIYQLVTEWIVWQAVSCEDRALRGQLSEYAREDFPDETEDDRLANLNRDLELAELLARMSGNMVAHLVVSILNDSGSITWSTENLFNPTPDVYWRLRARTAIEVLAGRPEEAIAAWRERHEMVKQSLII
jgi:DNA-binding FadR family transcriptional regulator